MQIFTLEKKKNNNWKYIILGLAVLATGIVLFPHAGNLVAIINK